ncbi:MAG: hypothetical protein Q9211_005067 [Gyalolechia sp. 1 TL-2023]
MSGPIKAAMASISIISIQQKDEKSAFKLQQKEHEIMMLKLKNQEQETSLKAEAKGKQEAETTGATRAELQDIIYTLRTNALEILSADQTLQLETAHVYDAQDPRSTRMATQGVLIASLRRLRAVVMEVEALMNSHHQLVSRGTLG